MAQPILTALTEEQHTTPTPIQAQAIPSVLLGRDLLGIAQTGTGKTAAFALPVLSRLSADPKAIPPRGCRVLVLSPTRELSNQIRERFQAYGRHLPLRSAIVIGGVSIGAQVRALAHGVDILIATPGRLVDLMQMGAVRLDGVEILILDEADRMLDMGFIHSIRQIAGKIPKTRQSLFFSATMPTQIDGLAKTLLRDPVTVSVTPVAKTADRVEQHVIFVQAGDKPAVLTSLLSGPTVERALVFTRTKRGADRVVRALENNGIGSDAIHGNKSQPQRERALKGFRDGKIRVLVATDIAARGIDVSNITHVVNFDLPNEPESYVHRIGRTARAGAGGVAISLCAGDERAYLRDIEKLTRQTVPVMAAPAFVARPASAGPEKVWQPHVDPRAPVKSGRPSSGQQRRRMPEKAPTGDLTSVAFLGKSRQPAKAAVAGAGRNSASTEAERNDLGKGRTTRIRRNRHRGAPGRELSRAAG